MVKEKTHKQKQLKNKNYNRYVLIRSFMYAGIALCLIVGGVLFWFFNQKQDGQYMFFDWQRYFAFVLILPIIGLIVALIIQKYTSYTYVTKRCDIICYTRINGSLYGRIQGNHAKRRARVTIFIDFHTGNLDHVVDAPKLLPMPVLHVLPEYLMYLAFASLCRNNQQGVDTANSFITDNKYFHKNHKKANVMYAVAFGVVRYTQKMIDEQYEAALDCLRYIAIPPKKFKFYDSLVRFCKARAEHELALQAKQEGDLQKVVAYSKAAMGKYAHVGRNTGNLYLASQAEFFRVQLHEMLNGNA